MGLLEFAWDRDGSGVEGFAGMAFLCFANVQLAEYAVEMWDRQARTDGGFFQATQARVMLERRRGGSKTYSSPRFYEEAWNFCLHI